MELKEFIETALTEIIKGVESVQKELESTDSNAIINPSAENPFAGNDIKQAYAVSKGYYRITDVSFNVGVTISNKENADAGIKVVTGVFNFGGKIDDTNEKKAINEISFVIPISLPSVKG